MASTYVTTPIYYPNDVPHLGTAYPTVAADIVARWARLSGQETFFLTGTDEHGKKIENAARKRQLAPKEFVDELAQAFKKTFRALNVSANRFIRTTDEDHVQLVQEILQRVYDRGDIYKGLYEGLYCVECEAYYKEDDLKEGCCPVHGRPVEHLTEECYYFKLSNYQQWLLDYYRNHPDFVMPKVRCREVVSFVERGLDDLSISRSTFSWGIRLPFDDAHIAYVWFDALLNYITGAGYLEDPDHFRKFWPTTTHIIGKDILRFHAIIWPAMLHAAGLDQPRRIFAHGFWTINGRKFSKSLGNVILPEYLIDTYGLDPVRFYMFRESSFGADGDFSEAHLVQRNNSELAQGLGNLLQRVVSMIQKYRGGTIPAAGPAGETEEDLAQTAASVVADTSDSLEGLAFNRALESIWLLVSRLNVYTNDTAPWHLAKAKDEPALDTALAHLAEGLRFLSVLTAPFMPDSAEEIARRLGLAEVPMADTLVWGASLAGRQVTPGQPLFQMLEAPVEKVPDPVQHSASPDVLALGLSYCVAQLNGVTVRREVASLEERKRKIEAEIRAKGSDWMDDVPEVRAYKDLYARLREGEEKIPTPMEILSSYIFESDLGRLPQINAIVDLYNIYSLRHFVSIGAHDREKIRGPICLDITDEPVAYRPLGSLHDVDVNPGEYYWHDDEHVLCRLDIKQGENTKIDLHTQHIVLLVQANQTISADKISEVTEMLCKEIVELCGGSYQILN